MPADQPILALHDVHYGYVEAGHHHPILQAIEASVARGESVALVGRSGAGKSSLLNLAAGLARPDRGRIDFAGSDLARLDERARTRLRRRHIGFVYQFFNLIDTLSVRDNAVLPLELDGRVSAADYARVERLLAAVGLSARAESMPDTLSGGEQQRVALVRALAAAPELVLADEPTGNLDSETGARVLDLLDELVRAAGHSLLLVTHSPAVAARADRTLHLVDGRLQTPEAVA